MTRRTIRVVITGMGLVTPLGRSPAEVWARLVARESSARSWPDLEAAGFRSTVACRVGAVDGDPRCRGRMMALEAAAQAVAQARLTLPDATGVFIGSTLGESLAFEEAAEGQTVRLADYDIPSFARAIRRRFALHGPSQAMATACAAGNYAVGAALSALRAGRVPAALAGGVEPFSRLAMAGFSRSRAMAAAACRPFDRDRSGMLLGEGAAVFVLEPLDAARVRGATPLAEVVAIGHSCDAHHPTAPRPDGSGMRRAMQAALVAGAIDAGDIDWVNAHGSGTRLSDAAEACAIRDVFGSRLPPISGSKGALGHALGASSAIELAICLMGLGHQVVPPTAGHEAADDADGVTCTRAVAPGAIRWVLNNAFAFGGVNSSLLVRRWEP